MLIHKDQQPGDTATHQI